MQKLDNWQVLIERGLAIVALEAANVDREFILRFFKERAREFTIPCYYWNLGYSCLQKVELDKAEYQLSDTDFSLDRDSILPFLLKQRPPGIFILDDLLNFEKIELIEQRKREAQLQNLLDRLRASSEQCYLVLLGSYVQFSEKVGPEIPILKYSLPNEREVQFIVNNFCQESGLELNDKGSLQRLVVACQGLPRGEIEIFLKTYFSLAEDVGNLADLILQHKVHQLRGLGLEFIAEPDVSSAGGLDLLQQFFYEKVVKLNEPSARKYQLRPPRGMLLLGFPGTGKTLSAKLAAKALGYSLLALSWGNVLGSDNPDKTLAKILEVADCLDRCILLGDDFDKSFTGWEEGGIISVISYQLSVISYQLSVTTA